MTSKPATRQSIEDVDSKLYKRAKRHLATVTTENAIKVKGHERYWTVHFLELFFRRCEHKRLDHPLDALAEVEHLTRLPILIRIGDEPGHFRSEAERRSWLLRCYALEGEIASLACRPEQMAEAFRKAKALAENHRILLTAGAELLRRQAVAALREDQPCVATRRVKAAETLYRRLKPGVGLGEALIIFGLIEDNPGDGLVAAAEITYRLSPRRRYSARLWDAALAICLQEKISNQGSLMHYQATACWLVAARKTWFRKRTKCRRKLGLIWGEGRALAWLGLNAIARRRLIAARRGFLALGYAEQITVSTLDLAYEMKAESDDDSAVETLQTSLRRLEQLNALTQLKETLHLAQSMACRELAKLRQETALAHLPRAETTFPIRSR